MNSYVTENFIMIYITVPSMEEARKIANLLTEKKLAGCVSIIPNIVSVYRFEGKIEEYQEEQLLVKTKSSLFDEVVEEVKKVHTYKLPEIVAVPFTAMSNDYFIWLNSETK